MDSILIVEDSEPTARTFCHYLAEYKTEVAVDICSARQSIARSKPALVLLDIHLPDGDGRDLLYELRSQGHTFPVVMTTSHSSIETAVETMKSGADHFLEKPFSNSALKTMVSSFLEKKLTSTDVGQEDDFTVIGDSDAIQDIYRTVELIAHSDAFVFISGESGTGKELLARAIHEKSHRKDGPFVSLNCAAFSRDLIESEVFGHAKGAFTNADFNRKGAAVQADGGTLFLDEVCDMDIKLQGKILRFLQSKLVRPVGNDKETSVDVRIVCATNKDPLSEVRAGRFREDLFYRLYVISIRVPPLRERKKDVISIANHYLNKYLIQEGTTSLPLSATVKAHLLAYPWPGNIRELQNVIQNIVVLNPGHEVTVNMLPGRITDNSLTRDTSVSMSPSYQGRQADEVKQPQPMWEHVKKHVSWVLARCNDNVSRAASILEISPSTLYRMQKGWEAKPDTHN